ncbi:MAG: hypothetical protein NUV52_01850, partial [Candidatus Roizmanbacteria bacterium]|nr:hypothetical protein [Candidatus Roizmanbacteria bacterium]
ARSVSATVTTDISGYCKDGYYQIPGEQVCSRAPNCDGYGYDELNTSSKMKSAQSCMGDGDGRDERGCAGYVPLCCYEMARTGQYTKCIGYWERLWCSQDLCTEAKNNGASNDECGGSCQCAHANNSYCGKITSVPIEQRLGIAAPSPTASAPSPTARPTARPTATPTTGITPGVTNPAPTSTTIPTTTLPTQSPTQVPVITIPFGNQTYNPPPSPYIPPTPLPLMPINNLSELNLPSIEANVQVIRSHVDPEKITFTTQKVLDAPKKVTKTIQSADIELEATIDSWWISMINRIRDIVL